VEWDQPLVGEVRDIWIKLFRMLVLAGGINFKRCTRPEGAFEGCILICYFDGSDGAFGVVVYARWMLDTGEVVVYIVASKSKDAPMYSTSIPRMELEGATLLVRLVLRIVLSLSRLIFLGIVSLSLQVGRNMEDVLGIFLVTVLVNT
jgi:hypothetical protein